jgi:hypothetical protein
MTFYLQKIQKNRQDIFYENTPLTQIKQLGDYFLSEEGYVFREKKNNYKVIYWIIEDPFGKTLRIENNKVIEFAQNLNLSWVILKRNFNRGIKIKNTYNIINVNKNTYKKVNINNNFFKGYDLAYLMVSNFLEYDKNNRVLKIIHIDENKNNNNIENLKLISSLENNEIIKQVNEFPDYYATTKGRIFKDVGLDFFEERNKYITPYGYHVINIGKRNYFVHRLVAMTLLENINNLPEVNHKNEIKTDNRVENLEWVTKIQNLNHSRYKLGRARSLYVIKNIKTNEIFKTNNLNDFSKEKNLTSKLLRKTHNDSKKEHKGYKIIERVLLKDLNQNSP